jgi:hypothetical protein
MVVLFMMVENMTLGIIQHFLWFCLLSLKSLVLIFIYEMCIFVTGDIDMSDTALHGHIFFASLSNSIGKVFEIESFRL